MPVDHIRYDILVQEALRGMVRDVLAEAAKSKSMPGEHHFFITFDTTAEDVLLSPRLRAQYPEEMTVVLQHQFWDLKVTDEAFEVGLSFGGVAERLRVSVRRDQSVADPSVQFTLQFESLAEAPDEDADEARPKPNSPTGKPRSLQRQETKGPNATSVPASPLPFPPLLKNRKTSRPTRVAPKWCGSTASARSNGQGLHQKTNQGSRQNRERHLRPDRGAG